MKEPKYIDGVGWRYDTEHRMTRWPDWKDSRLPGTYMFTLNVNGGQKLLGHLDGTSAAVYRWMHEHAAEVKTASDDALYYRHALLGTKAMPFVLAHDRKALAVQTAAYQGAEAIAQWPESGASDQAQHIVVGANGQAQRRFYDVASSTHRKTHFPVEALRQPDAPHIVLSPLGLQVKAVWERMPEVVPQIEQVCLAIMPNHIHALIAVNARLPRAIGAVIRSFMGTTSHCLHKMIADGTVLWNPTVATINRKATVEKPSLWEEGFCVGVCQTEEKLHTRIGYIIENPFFGILEGEQHDMMQRVMQLTVAERSYGGYGNMLLLKEPDRLQVFCHRKHPVTQEPYHLTQDFLNEKAEMLRAAKNGAVIVTPGISPGEADIMWSVLKVGGSVINIQKEELPVNEKWHPEKERRLYCSQGKILVLAVNDMPNQAFRDRMGQVIPADSKYVRFHLLNLVAAEICAEGVEHSVTITRAKATS